jgi:drug/metabolite transporter (DMT)-like permease
LTDDAAARPGRWRLGSAWMLVAGVLLAGMGVFAKIGSQQFSSAELVFYRSLLSALMVMGVVRSRRLPLATPHWKMHLLRSLSGFTGMMLLFYVIGVLPLATATTLNYTSPLFLVLLTALLLRQRIRIGLLVAAALGFVGVVLLLRPTFSANQTTAGLLGLASGLFGGMAFFSNRQLGLLGEPAWRVVLYFSLLGTLGAGLLAACTGFHAIGLHGALVLLGLGSCAVLGQLAMTQAYSEGEALTVGSLAYSTVVFTVLASAVIWGEQLPLGSWLAMGLIIASGVLAMRVPAAAAAATPARQALAVND